jgi:hypothetical protein
MKIIIDYALRIYYLRGNNGYSACDKFREILISGSNVAKNDQTAIS